MAAVLVPVILVVIVIVLVAMALKRFGRAEVRHSDSLQNADRPTLRYAVPPGQDPAVVLTGLRQAGYDVSPDADPGPSSPVVIIGAHGGTTPDREAVRRALADIEGTHSYPGEREQVQRSEVTFLDE